MKKGHMRGRGSFDFHMPVIAKETTSFVFTDSACLQIWLPYRLHFGATLRNKGGEYFKKSTRLWYVHRTIRGDFSDAFSFQKHSR